MAKETPQQKARKVTKKTQKLHFPLEKQNLVWFLIGLGTIALGYILMMTGISEEPALPKGKWNNVFAVEIGPFLLFIGYCVIIPFSILKKFKKNTSDG